MNLRVGSVLPPATRWPARCACLPGECCTLDYPDSNQVSVAVPVPGTGARVLSIGISTGVQEAPGERIRDEIVPALQDAAERVSRLIRLAPV